MIYQRPAAGLHLPGADVGGRGGRIIAVKKGFNGGIELLLGGQDEVDGIASSAVATGVRRNVVGGGLGLLSRIGGGDGQAAYSHHRQVHYIVTNVSKLIQGDPGTGKDVVDRVHLARLALVYELELEVLGANRNCGRLALGDDADPKAAEACERNPQAVMCSESFYLKAMAFAVEAGLAVIFRDEEELAVGEDSIDVEDEDFDAAGAVFRG